MQDFRSRLPSRRTVFRILAISVIAVGALILLLAGFVYSQAVGRFNARRVSLPTRIYTDVTPLAPEGDLSRATIVEKLERLGYRNGEGLRTAGDAVIGGDTIDLFLRAFRYPGGDREAQQVRLSFTGGKLATVASLDGNPATGAALEPELLTSILSDKLENRRPVKLDQVPQHLIDAVVVTEDIRFFQHPGVDPLGIFRAFFRNLRAGGVAEGGSTLTQQLVKNYYLTNERTFRRKIVEAFMSVILDAKYSKREILEAYLNDIYLGRNRSISIVGVGEAARFYFGKPVSEISVAESAMLAGMIRSPNNYSPFDDREVALARRKTVLGLLRKHSKINDAVYADAMETDLPKKPTRTRSGLTSIPFYVDRVMQEMALDYQIEDVKGRGLAIYTAIDLDWQDAAARRLESGLAGLEKGSRRLRRSENPLQGVIIAVDVRTGEIKALVGGRNYNRSQFNRALNAKRQVGSLFKPFVFAAAFEPSLSKINFTPATLVNDSRFVLERKFGQDWSPRNYNGQYHGVVTARHALEQSLNVASVRIGLAAGLDSIITTAKTLGIDTELEDVPSLILGAVAIPPIEMAESYTTLARMGSRVPLRTIRFVADDDGKAIGDGSKVEAKQVFPARDVFLTVNLMEGVVQRGTAAGVRRYGFRKTAAGKTGTTNDKRDAWFIGFTPQTLALTWLGFDDNAPTGLSGSDGAVPIWGRFMSEITATEPNAQFPVPGRITFAQIDRTSGGLVTSFCPKETVIQEAFKEGTTPRTPCPKHQPAAVPPPVDPYATGTVDPYATQTSTDPFATSTDPYTTSTATTPDPSTTQPPPTQTVDPAAPLDGGFGRPPATSTSQDPPTTTAVDPPEPR